MYNLIVAIISFTEFLITYNFFIQIGEKKRQTYKCIILGAILFESCAIVNIMLSNTVWINAIYNTIIYAVFGIMCFNIKPNKVIFYSIILNVICGALEFATIFLISVVTKTQPDVYLEKFNFLIIDIAISKSLYLFTCLLLAKVIKKDKVGIKIPIGLFMYPLIVVATLLIFWKISTEYIIQSQLQIILSIISMMLFVSIIVLFIIYQHSLERENDLHLLQNEIEKIEIEKSYYDILEKQNENLLIYAHDAKKHLSMIKSLNTNPQIEKYIGTMTDQLKIYSNTCHSGNHTLDVIIGRYVTECEIKNIDFSFDLHLANFKYIDDYDLVTILGNVLDNAIEAVEKSEEKIITLLTEHRNTYDVLIISNSCDIHPVANNKELKTTKQNKTMHGMGIKSVLKTLKKYNSDLEWEYDSVKNVFTLTVAFLRPE